MKKIFVLIIISLSFLQLKAQTFYSQMAAQYAEEGNYEKAIELEKEGLEMWERIHGKGNSDYAMSLHNLANYYYYLGSYQEAIRLVTVAMEIFKEIFGEKNPNYATSLCNLALYYTALGNYQEAIRLGREDVEISKEILGEHHPDYATSLNNLGGYYSVIGDYPEAIRLGTEALQIRKEILGEHHPDYATSLGNLAGYYSDLGNYEEAISLGSEAMEIFKEILGEHHPDYAISLGNLAGYYSNLGNYHEAIRLGTEAMVISKELHGEKHPDFATSLGSLAVYNSNLGNYPEASRLVTKAMEIFKEIHGEKHPDYATSLGILARYYSNTGDYPEAIRLGTEALQIRKEIFGEHHPNYASSLGSLASYYANLGDYEKAIRLEKEVLQIRKEILGEKHPDYTTSLGSMARYCFYLGDYHETIRLGTEALHIQKAILGEKHPNYARSLGNMASYYSDLGNFEEAISLGTEAMEIFKDILGGKHPDYATSLGSLAGFYSDLGNYEEAISLGTEAMEIFKEIFGEKHPHYATSLGNLASYYFYMGNYHEAIRLGAEALQIQKEILGQKHPGYASFLNNLATYYANLGDNDEAIKLGTRTLQIRKEILGEKHPDYTHSLQNLITINHSGDNSKFVSDNSIQVSENKINYIKNTFLFLTPLNRAKFWDKENSWFQYKLPYYSYLYGTSNLIKQSSNGLLLSKGLLLNSELEFDQFIGETGNEELLEKYNEIKSLRFQLNKLYEKPIAERSCDTDSLERHVNELERKLMDESSEYGDYTKNLSVTWEDVQKGLGKKDAAIEFVHFPLNQDSTMYVAYILRPEMESPAMVKLFEEKDLTKLNDNYKYSKTTASNLIWGKLQSELEGVENVYFAPDGILHQIPIEYLPDFEDEDKLISDRYNLHRVSSTRQLALRKDTKKSNKAVVYGGIQYDTNPELLAEESRKYELLESRGFQPWYNLSDTLSMRSGVKYLPFTLTEATSVSAMLEENHQQPILITGKEATEASFKSLSGKKNGILHIATHGFYWQEEEADKQAQMNDRLLFMSQFGDNARRSVEDKALTRTGLFMAGANNALSGKEIPEDIDDGILTASEIANLDLRGTDLVVLSACQTGMGDIGGDGVFGLQRGFKKAGANSILMSLWDVDDAATGMFMEEFYRNLTSGKSKQESLKAAQDKVRNFMGEINGEYRNFSNARYWAAFILLDGLN